MENKIFELEVLGSVSPYSNGNRNCPGYLVRYGDYKILLDCGNGITRNMKLDNYPPDLSVLPDDLENLFIWISHYHKDHYGDLFSLGYVSYLYHKGGALKSKIKLLLPTLSPLDSDGFYDYQVIKHMKEQFFDIEDYNDSNLYNCQKKVDDLTLTFLENHHTSESYSIKLDDGKKKVVYTGDIGYDMAEKLIDFCSNADLLIAESTFLAKDNQHSNTHLNSRQAASIAKLANVKKLILTHFWPGYDVENYLEEAMEIFENTEVAFENKILKIGAFYDK